MFTSWRAWSCRLAGSGVAMILLTGAAGCVTTGPVTVRGDRFNFNKAGAASTNEQILLNIVRLRYGEPIYFVDVGSMVSHYSIGASGGLSGFKSNMDVWNSPTLRAIYGMRGEPPSEHQTWEASINYSDSPTLTYTPLTGEEFSRRVMMRIPPETIVYLSESGWGIGRLLECCVQRLNEVGNTPIRAVRKGMSSPDIEKFRRLTDLMQEAQDSGILRFAMETDAQQNLTFIVEPQVPEGWEENRREFRELLGLPAENFGRLRLTTNSVRQDQNEIAIETRSVLGTMWALSQGVDVPGEHVKSNQVSPQLVEECGDPSQKWLQVKNSRLPQVDPFVQVFYHGYWFYVDKSDLSSKDTFSLLTYLFSLQASSNGQGVPVLTVQTGR